MSNVGKQNQISQRHSNPSSPPAMVFNPNNLNYSGCSAEYADLEPKQIQDQNLSQPFANKRPLYENGRKPSFTCSTPMPTNDDSSSASTSFSSGYSSTNTFTPIHAKRQQNEVTPVATPRARKTQIELQALMELQMFENQASLNDRKPNIQNFSTENDFHAEASCNANTSPSAFNNSALSNASRDKRTDTTINYSDGENSIRRYKNLEFVSNSPAHISTDSSGDADETPENSDQIKPASRTADYFDPLRFQEKSDEPLVLSYEAERALVYFDPLKLQMPDTQVDPMTQSLTGTTGESGNVHTVY